MAMGLLDTKPPSGLSDPDVKVLCRCGHCRAVVDVSKASHRSRCGSCGWLNTVPSRVQVLCQRCGHEQPVRFGQRSNHVLCSHCGHALHIREIELTALGRTIRRSVVGRRRASRRESIVFTMLLYALVLLFFLLWFSR